jgi:hypothetical protein
MIKIKIRYIEDEIIDKINLDLVKRRIKLN